MNNNKKIFSSAFVGVGLLMSASSFAQTCMNDVYNAYGQGGDLNCTANDISTSAASVNVLDDGCLSPLDTVTLELFADVTLTAQARYDLGFYFATDGGDALSGACEIATLPINPDPPFVNLDVSDAADTCGDIDAVHSPLAGVSFGTMTVACSDLDGDGKLEISSCTSWRQPGKNETCDEGIDAYPGAPSKCRCTPLEIDEVVIPPLAPGVEIVKGPELQTVVEGGTATFTIDVVNTGNVELTNVVVSDPLAPDCNAVFPVLAVGATESYTCTVDNVVDGFTNVAGVTTDEGVSDDDDAVVEVEVVVMPQPGVVITKGPELQIIEPGGTATFTIDVINTGNVDLTNVVVSDPLVPACDAVFMIIPVGATESYICTLDNIVDGFTNVASVSTDEGVSDDDDAVVEVRVVVEPEPCDVKTGCVDPEPCDSKTGCGSTDPKSGAAGGSGGGKTTSGSTETGGSGKKGGG